MSKELKYGNVVQILTIIDTSITGLITLIGFINVLSHIGSSNSNIEELLSIIIPLGIVSAFKIVAITKVRTSVGWNIFILVISSIQVIVMLFTLHAVAYLILYMGLSIALIVLTALVLTNANKTSTTSGNLSLESRLNNLKSLYDQGLISLDEYTQRRQDLINSI
ncbi:conserved hypothetical protein [Alteracholeplasma palmae J233]|uniref:SHOCT domain-containing protein n=1 Tax=Alteracholeplasma palmae (strain ATCC 49389 / J233) TaxID=1318466 RepID=U4KNC5_ALTPJ|nr:SHOCT domain-containing protein [Alteracholeplasma palmae]CCV63680.1 conserved hypothetical protein [Alteracholeplasma palmae J233]